jgi:hypothetical protein
VDEEGRKIWIVDAHRDDGKRFIARSDEKLTAFLELESATRGSPSFTHGRRAKKAKASRREGLLASSIG